MHGGVMYSMMIIVNNTILHIVKFLREYLVVWLVGSLFPDQGLNLGHSSENPES